MKPNQEQAQLRKEAFKLLAKPRKAKSTDGCVYKKEGPYFWTIANYSYGYTERRVVVGIKPWSYDELLCSITHPDEEVHFPDKLRWDGFIAEDALSVFSKLLCSMGNSD